jgi:hypothetical protein
MYQAKHARTRKPVVYDPQKTLGPQRWPRTGALRNLTRGRRSRAQPVTDRRQSLGG